MPTRTPSRDPLLMVASAVPTRGHGDDLRAQGFQAVYVGELQHCGKTLILLAVFLELRHERAQLAVLLLKARDLLIDIDGTDVCEGRRDDGADLRDGWVTVCTTPRATAKGPEFPKRTHSVMSMTDMTIRTIGINQRPERLF